jgi:hypothetical protein
VSRWILAALMAAGMNKESRMQPNQFDENRVENFKTRVGFSKLANLRGLDGVNANWDDLPKFLASDVKPLQLDAAKVYGLEPGLTEAAWRWKPKKGETELTVSVFVSGTGAARAQEKLLSLASATMMVKIPYEPGPAGLGDLSVRSLKPPSDVVMWVYRNVCVHVDNQRSGRAAEPVARAIQRFMEAHRVPRLADHLPKIDRVDVSAKQVHVGDETRVSIVLGKGTAPVSVRTDFNEIGDHKLEVLSIQPLAAAYRAKEPGQARVDVPVFDRRTLLSPALSVAIEVLPAR